MLTVPFSLKAKTTLPDRFNTLGIQWSTSIVCAVVAISLTAYWGEQVISALLCSLTAGASLWKIRWQMPTRTLRSSLLLAILIPLGLMHSQSHNLFDAGRDAWYFLMPILGILAGGIIVRRTNDPVPLVVGVVVAGSIAACFFLVELIANISVLRAYDVAGVRTENGAGPTLSLLTLVVLSVWRKQIQARFRRIPTSVLMLCMVVNLAAVAFSFSRILWLGLIFAILISLIVKNTLRSLVRVTVLLGLIACLISIFSFVMPEDLRTTISDKIVNSVGEISPNDYSDAADINQNWRGFETLMGLRTYLDGSADQLILGHGFGELVNLGISIQLGDELFDRIPILHNGYVYLLVKVGLLGASLYSLWIVNLIIGGFRGARGANCHAKEAGQVCMSIGIYLLASTMVVSGIFNKLDGLVITLLLGAMQAAAGSQCSAVAIGPMHTVQQKYNDIKIA